jgi:hypothetical protein
MDINTPYLTNIVVTQKNGKVINGWDSDKELVEKHLSLDKVYQVHHTEIGAWSTKVYLMEVPGIAFNFEEL